jgi:hypothetical protein
MAGLLIWFVISKRRLVSVYKDPLSMTTRCASCRPDERPRRLRIRQMIIPVHRMLRVILVTMNAVVHGLTLSPKYVPVVREPTEPTIPQPATLLAMTRRTGKAMKRQSQEFTTNVR